MSVSSPTFPVGSFTREAFAAHLERVKHLPAWWLDRKRAAYERFAALPMPKRTDEGWRFSNFGALTLAGFSPAVGSELARASAPGFAAKASLTFVNNRAVARTGAAPAGVIFETLQNALLKHGDLVKAHLLTQPSKLGSDKFAALHEAFLEDGAFVHVAKGVEVADVLAVFHQAEGQGLAVFPHTLVVAEENAKVTVADFFSSTAGGFACGGNDLYAGHGAQVTYVAMQDWSRDTLSFQFNATVARRDAKVLSLNLHAGARQARHESFSQLQAPGAHSEMLALTVAHGTQEFDQRTLQIHQAPNTGSNLLYKNVLLDTAKTIFSGLIVVDPDAQKTDAYQSNRNLMLSDDAEAHSLPGLEIQANDVRCTHGATSARVDREQEFYLEARGIKPAQAKELLVFGFFEEVLGKIENEALHDTLTEIIRQKFKE
ncbi:Fe-S cluster assembly protein SufD [Oleiharenicola lentus]|uniref:Fe-S cluster assembly protein SufD n=1 Tax=Oleiharenicola lentus TaxID=2508720 RepID=A0A4Q1C7Z7_9BACT|nr:Fe-S cluster assembly protein SufD [Oleiharenicola lentus]RXK54941.1 Fe-S cluster assembly protein SufD [Oleiharenicola lentus]